ncbi:MAG: hypothetical protein VKL39_15090 [Leptolyngbyaceae bacterium]|nr:hypothetical protein [Leptolyngbyaceae bacterium]
MTNMKTLIVELKDGKDRKITIPDDWIITFGPVAIGARSSDDSSHVLRLYGDSGKKQLKAVFRNVRSFHEEGIQIFEKVVRKKNKTFRKEGANGGQTYSAEVRQTTWRNPFEDDPEVSDDFDVSENALSLPGSMSSEDF